MLELLKHSRQTIIFSNRKVEYLVPDTYFGVRNESPRKVSQIQSTTSQVLQGDMFFQILS